MDQEDYAPLFDAIEDGDLAEVESFLQTPGVDVDFVFETQDDDDFSTPLNWAIRWNQKSIVELLLDHGAMVNAVDGADKTPLQVACNSEHGNEEIARLLLEQGADIDAITIDDSDTPLTLACITTSNLGIIQLLINAGADVNGADGNDAPLYWAANCGDIKALELLIQAGADVNRGATHNYYGVPIGSTPLHWATPLNQSNCVTTLLAAGADPNVANSEGQTPLHCAAWSSSVDVFNALLTAGCDPLHQDNDGRTPLQYFFFLKRFNTNFSAEQFNVITALVAAGDRSWECVPTPCPGLEAAMVSVLRNAPDELPELFKRLDEEMTDRLMCQH